MKYIAVNEDHGLEFSQTFIPKITDDECLIQVRAIGINRADILQRYGKYPSPEGESDILGIEVAGEIVKCGKSVNSWKINDRVCCIVAGGGYAEFVKVKACHLIMLPNHYSYIQGAGLAETFLTAYQALFSIANIKPADKVMIHAGASGVGTAAIQLAKTIGCYVAATVGNDDKIKACLTLGADNALNYYKDDFEHWSKTEKLKFNAILDVVAGNYLTKNINISALDANIVILSILGGRYAETVDVAKLLQKRLTIHASTLRNRSDHYKSELIKNFVQHFEAQLTENSISPLIDNDYSWREVEKAHQHIQNNKNIGKVVLLVN